MILHQCDARCATNIIVPTVGPDAIDIVAVDSAHDVAHLYIRCQHFSQQQHINHRNDRNRTVERRNDCWSIVVLEASPHVIYILLLQLCEYVNRAVLTMAAARGVADDDCGID